MIADTPRTTADNEPARLARLAAEMGALRDENGRLEIENRLLREKLRLLNHRHFGASSEQTPIQQQAIVFNEAEVQADPTQPEPAVEARSTRPRKKPLHRTLDLELFDVEKVLHDLPVEEQVCPDCGEGMHPMGEEIREEYKIIPARIVLVKHIQRKYTCGNCHDDGTHTIVTAPMPAAAFPGSLASASAVAYILEQKFVQGLPLYRQEQQFARLGISLSRQTLANWVLKGADWLEPLYDRMRCALVRRDNLKADETRLQVLEEPGRAAQAQSFMWLYRTGSDGPSIVLFEYQPSRAREHPARFLEGFRGFLQTDGYSGYEKLPGVRLVGCWSHARRKFDEALQALSQSQRQAGGTTAHVGLDYCNRLFAIERDVKELSPEERYAARLARSQPLLDELRTWMEVQAPKVLPKSALGAALGYLRHQWDKLVLFLEDGRLDLDNNSSERAIKPFVIGRKNWLFANSVKGAQASAVIYSVVETAKENGLNPMAYLTYLFEQLPNITTSKLDSLLPWSDSLPDSLGVPRTPAA